MRGLTLGAALATVAVPVLTAELILSSTEVKNGSPICISHYYL